MSQYKPAASPPGYTYVDTFKNHYIFQETGGSYQNGFKVMFCLPEDMTQANLNLMAKMGISRNEPKGWDK